MTAVLEKPTLSDLLNGYKRAPKDVANGKKQWPVEVKARFIEPGLVNYDDLGFGMTLVRKPFLDKALESFKGKPVLDEVHKDAKPENFKEIADGMVTEVWYDAADGWYWCKMRVWDDATLLHTKDPSYFVSCAYDPKKIDRNGGSHHNVPYDTEFLDGEYTHLAIVKDPRYEGARIVWNSLGAKPMKNLLKLFRAPVAEEAAEINPAETFLEVDGEKVSVENAVKLIKAENAKVKGGAMKDEDVVEIDGKRWTGKEIKNAIANAKKAKNKGEDGEKAGDQEEAVEDEEKEGKKEAKNDVKEDSVEEDTARRDRIDAKNSLEKKSKDEDHIEDFKKVAEMRNNQPGVPTISTQVERLKAGAERYGKMTKEVA